MSYIIHNLVGTRVDPNKRGHHSIAVQKNRVMLGSLKLRDGAVITLSDLAYEHHARQINMYVKEGMLKITKIGTDPAEPSAAPAIVLAEITEAPEMLPIPLADTTLAVPLSVTVNDDTLLVTEIPIGLAVELVDVVAPDEGVAAQPVPVKRRGRAPLEATKE